MFTVAPREGGDSPWPIFERLLARLPELEELKSVMDMGVTLAFLMRDGGIDVRGRKVLGACCTISPGSGPLKGLLHQLLSDTLGYEPTFVIVINEEWWREADTRQREALVFHEAMHVEHQKDEYDCYKFNRSTGDPIVGIRPHDIEEFADVVRRYGEWSPDITQFRTALEEYDKRGPDISQEPVKTDLPPDVF